jgi:hypothetical protein
MKSKRYVIIFIGLFLMFGALCYALTAGFHVPLHDNEVIKSLICFVVEFVGCVIALGGLFMPTD